MTTQFLERIDFRLDAAYQCFAKTLKKEYEILLWVLFWDRRNFKEKLRNVSSKDMCNGPCNL